MYQNAELKSRYAVTCPVCSVIFRPGLSSPMGITTFRCPQCGELLKYATRHELLLLTISMVAAVVLVFYLGYRGLNLVLMTIGCTFLIMILVVSVIFHIWPPKVQQSLRKGDSELHLTDKPHR